MLLVPLLQIITDGGSSDDRTAMFFQNLAERAGVSLTLGTVLFIYVLLLTVNAIIQYRKSMLDAGYQQSLIYELRRRLFRKILFAEWHDLNSRSKTNHLQVLTKEIPVMAEYIYYLLRLLMSLIITASYAAYAFAVSAGFTSIVIVTGLALFILLRRYLFRAFALGEGYTSSYTKLLKYIDDFWQTVKIAKVHSSEGFYYERFDEVSNSLLELETRMQKNWSLPQLIYRVAGIIVLVVVVYFGYKAGHVPLASLFVLVLLFSRIYPRFVEINNDLNSIMSGAASVRLVMELDEELADPEPGEEKAIKPLTAEREIKLENVHFSYDDSNRLFEEFSATIPARSITGIVGESGIGKTTLIDIIAGLQRPEAGRVLVDGRELSDDLLPSWRAAIGYLPQSPFFIDGTLRDNLVWDSNNTVTDDQVMKVLEQVNASHLLARFEEGLDAFIVNYHFTFSGGECQRLALARVLLRKPHLLLLDEATSSLDTENESLIMDVLAELKSDITIVFVTHRRSLLKRFDRVISL